MRRLQAIAGGCFVVLAAQLAAAEEVFTNSVLRVAPATLDFGSVAAGATATNTFVVENKGGAKLEGKIPVAAPFKVLGSTKYTLRAREALVVSMTYTPTGAETDTEIAKFSGDGVIEAIVTGKLAVPVPKKAKPKYRAGPMQD